MMTKEAATYMTHLAAERNAVFEQMLIAIINREANTARLAGKALAKVGFEMERVIRSQIPKPTPTEVQVFYRGYDFHASIPGTSFWEKGSSSAEAIGNLVLTHAEKLSVKISIVK
jgi:hypothetical protein